MSSGNSKVFGVPNAVSDIYKQKNEGLNLTLSLTPDCAHVYYVDHVYYV